MTGSIAAFGQVALATTPLLVAVASGLFDVANKNVVVEARAHGLLRWLLYLLLAVAGLWIASAVASMAETGRCEPLRDAVRVVFYLQAVLLGLSVLLVGAVVRRVGHLLETGVS